jgi:hypothetical protein
MGQNIVKSGRAAGLTETAHYYEWQSDRTEPDKTLLHREGGSLIFHQKL